MIGAMQEFNHQYGVDSYMRIRWERKTEVQYGGRLNLTSQYGTRPDMMTFSDNPQATYNFYADGVQVSTGLPYIENPFYFDGSWKNMAVEIRSNGPYIERVQRARIITTTDILPLRLAYRSGGGQDWTGVQISNFIRSVEFSDGCGLKTIGQLAFQRMRNCDFIVLPPSLALIERNAFYMLNRYCQITCKARIPPTVDDTTLFNVPSGAVGTNARTPYDDGTLYVPKGCAQIYRQPTIGGVTNAWSRFQNIVELDY